MDAPGRGLGAARPSQPAIGVTLFGSGRFLPRLRLASTNGERAGARPGAADVHRGHSVVDHLPGGGGRYHALGGTALADAEA